MRLKTNTKTFVKTFVKRYLQKLSYVCYNEDNLNNMAKEKQIQAIRHRKTTSIKLQDKTCRHMNH